MAEFHERLNGERYQEIYSQADAQFKAAGNEAEYTNFSRGIHEKLGDANNSSRQNISIKATPTGSYVTVIYETEFTHGKATETFTWRGHGDRLLLVGYNIQSRELFTK